jgi:hypothetical protein
MRKPNNRLAALATIGLVVSAPVSAQTRSAQALPAASVQLDPAVASRDSAPLADASELGGRASPAILLGIIALLALLIAAAGGGGGGNDSPG